MTTVVNRINQENNQFGALVSESEYDSKDSETASVTLARHSDYIREVQSDQSRLLSVAQLREIDKDWETNTDRINMKVTVETLEGLCTETISPFYGYDTILVQNWKRVLVTILSQFPNKVHNHGHAYLSEDKECFQKRSGLVNAELAVPTRPIRNDAPRGFSRIYILP